MPDYPTRPLPEILNEIREALAAEKGGTVPVPVADLLVIHKGIRLLRDLDILQGDLLTASYLGGLPKAKTLDGLRRTRNGLVEIGLGVDFSGPRV